MRKVILFQLILISVLLLVGCINSETKLSPSEKTDTDFDTTASVNFSTQYPIYRNDIDRITCFIQNNTDQEYLYGAGYTLEHQIDGTWYQVPFPENVGWTSEGYMLAPRASNTIYINLSFFNYDFTDGIYRILKQVGDLDYLAQFELGISKISQDTPYGFVALDKLNQDYSYEVATQDGILVNSLNGVENGHKVNEFVDNVSRNVPSMLRVMSYTVEGDPILYDITYHVGWSDYYIITTDNSRDQFAGKDKGITHTNYSYLVTDGSMLYLTNHVKWMEESEPIPNWSFYFMEEENLDHCIPIVEGMTDHHTQSSSTIYKSISTDGSQSIILTDIPLEYGYSNVGFGEMRTLENKSNTALKIEEVLWEDESTVLFVATTNTNMKYYEFYDVKNNRLLSYTTSANDYQYINGHYVIPD